MSVSVTCTRCGQPMNATDRFCANCGTGNPMVTRPPDSGASGSVWQVVQESLRATTRGEFDIAGELGHGGMAAVYLAHDIALDKKVAIKVMAPSLMADPSMIGRFQDEARTVAKLEHPNIVTVHAVEHHDQLHFFVLDFVEQGSLDAVMRRYGPLPVPVVKAWLPQGAGGQLARRGRGERAAAAPPVPHCRIAATAALLQGFPGELRWAIETTLREPQAVPSVRALAERARMDRRTCLRWFAKAQLPPPSVTLTALRVVYAHRLLQDPGYTVEDVATRLGYAQARSFAQATQEVVGPTPGEMRGALTPEEAMAIVRERYFSQRQLRLVKAS